MRDPIFRGEGVLNGRGQPVLLIPGFLVGDGSLRLMTGWLRRTGHHTSKAGIRLNVDCSETVVERVEDRLEQLVERQGLRAAVVGQSRGGTFAKVLAQRRPDLVAGIVTLGTPRLDPSAIHRLVRLQLDAVATLGTLGAPGLFRRSCLEGDCCSRFWEQYSAPMRRGIGYVSIYSRSDGIVDWRACLDASAEHVEVAASHCGMGMNRNAYAAIAAALAEFGRRDARRPARPQAVPMAGEPRAA